ncbi:4-hydroxybenzoate 3-monooxygenase [Streptomyces albiaxialis]|uniref:4-hydroxybenzoate 3-monooxygenase n=1 Tax=Streptomyces albiaxialis TaxID=329523 RepID=A0ABN2WRB6_9ACTN
MSAVVARRRVRVAVVGAGPAGLVLANVLLSAGVPVEVVERQPREALERHARAGLVEHRVAAYLRAHGLAHGLLADGVRHGWCDFLCEGERVRIDYAARTGGTAHWVYPQHLLVADLVRAFEERGGTIHFGRPARDVEEPEPGRPRVRCDGLLVEADAVAGCDGHRGVTRRAVPRRVRGDLSVRYASDWLTALAEVDRPPEGVTYGLHHRGFAGMMPRTARLARCYLQIPAGGSAAEWPASRVREELRRRLDAARHGLPRVGRIEETGVLRMGSTISRELRHGHVFLAGDAAHRLVPAAAKGMNTAVADAAHLAEALTLFCRTGERAALDSYSARRTAQIWRTQEFADRLMDLLTVDQSATVRARRFALRLKRERLRRLAEPGDAAADFAVQYAGQGPLTPPLTPPLPAARTAEETGAATGAAVVGSRP